MDKPMPLPDRNGIIITLPDKLSSANRQRLKKFGALMVFYDFAQDHVVRPRIHKADTKRHHTIINNMIAPIRNSRVIDIACGTGNAIAYFDCSNAYTGVDLSYAMLRQAAKKAAQKAFKSCLLIQGNAEELQFESESYDFALMDTALHMVPKYRRAIVEVARILTDEGVFACSTPVVGINKDFDRRWEQISAKRGLHSLTVKEIDATCAQNGLFYQPYATNGGVLYFYAQKINNS